MLKISDCTLETGLAATTCREAFLAGLNKPLQCTPLDDYKHSARCTKQIFIQNDVSCPAQLFSLSRPLFVVCVLILSFFENNVKLDIRYRYIWLNPIEIDWEHIWLACHLVELVLTDVTTALWPWPLALGWQGELRNVLLHVRTRVGCNPFSYLCTRLATNGRTDAWHPSVPFHLTGDTIDHSQSSPKQLFTSNLCWVFPVVHAWWCDRQANNVTIRYRQNKNQIQTKQTTNRQPPVTNTSDISQSLTSVLFCPESY